MTTLALVHGRSEEAVNRFFGRELAQLVAGVASKLRVLSKRLNRESNLIDDSCAGSVPTSSKFEVGQFVIRAHAIKVVNRFFGQQGAAKVPFHHMPVFVDVTPSDAIYGREAQHNIAAHQSAHHRSFCARAQLFVPCNKVAALEFSPARITACFRAVKAVAFGGEHGPANGAGTRFGFGLPDKRARARAVYRVFTPRFAVGAQSPHGERKRLVTRCALKLNGFGALMWTAFCREVCVVTRLAAKLVRFSGALDRERFPTVRAGSYQTHYPLLMVAEYYLNTIACATPSFAGAL